jgi:hypothetical protein
LAKELFVDKNKTFTFEEMIKILSIAKKRTCYSCEFLISGRDGWLDEYSCEFDKINIKNVPPDHKGGCLLKDNAKVVKLVLEQILNDIDKNEKSGE